MKIQDLSKELDTKTMKAVRGGDNGASAASSILQAMGIDAPVAVGYGAGSAGNTFIHVDGSQSGSVSNNQTSGDKFAAFLGTLKGL
ncbi:MAG: hypothetical protein ACLQO1_02455 [Steroidobacteraceae bacterium]